MTLIATNPIRSALSGAGLLVDTRGAIPEQVTSVEDDSRRVARGSLFIAVKGSERDGHDFLGRAAEAGAAMAIVEDPKKTTLPSLVVREGRRAAAIAASAAYHWPARQLQITGVTGTNGKTTTAHIIRHLLDGPKARAASIGTVGVLIGSEGTPFVEDTSLTTPGPVELQRLLRGLVDAGVRHVAMEVSSHALHPQRVGGVGFDTAVFTNLSRDHLDYHRTMEGYR
ncbi:MAG: Mur ligase family protein, partial [Gemmatimonadaceae bacterium]